jgi:hypothetical protein
VGASEIQQFEAIIFCPSCAAEGAMVWENVRGERALIRLSAGFRERLSKRPPYPIELVCTQCGAAQLELT